MFHPVLILLALASRGASAAPSLVSTLVTPTPTPTPEPGYTIKDATPNYPFDPNTVAGCTWWWDHDGSLSCEAMPREWGITLEDFLKWNPSITEDCGNFTEGRSYCVEAPSDGGGPPPSSTTGADGPEPTEGNGIETPLPIQPDMVDNCDTFYLAKRGDSCDSIASKHGISSSQFREWNPSVGSDCTGLWADTYTCVGIIGGATSTSGSGPTTTSAGNGVSTPSPTQPSIVDNCAEFYFVEQGDSCDAIARKHGISTQQFTQWNPSVGTDCTGLWANAYACVDIIGGAPTESSTRPTSTTTGNGISTPTPTQPEMISNCNKFYMVKKGDSCAVIARNNGITEAQFQQWNPSVGATCSGLWADAYACVGRVGTPTNPPPATTTESGNGVATPTPIQDGMTKNCKTFHKVVKGDTCDAITKKYKITLANFVRWNPAVKSDCTGMWANTYACVALL